MEAEKVKRSVDKYYFRCYDSLELHNTMMKDRQRLEFYNRAIVGNAHLFKGKTVIDVGSGLGVLSIFAAQAGAKKVIATEVSPKINDLALKAFKRNGVDHIVQLRQGRIEDLKIDDDIDIIISEWMGYCLNYEKMLPSVIWARNKYKPKLMIPNEASLLVCGFHDQEFYKVKISLLLTKNATIFKLIWKLCPADLLTYLSFLLSGAISLDSWTGFGPGFIQFY